MVEDLIYGIVVVHRSRSASSSALFEDVEDFCYDLHDRDYVIYISWPYLGFFPFELEGIELRPEYLANLQLSVCLVSRGFDIETHPD